MTDSLFSLFQLLAREYNCSAEAFNLSDNILTTYPEDVTVRRTVLDDRFFRMVTTGNNAVITANEVLHPYLRHFIKDKVGHWLFELPNLLPIERELNGYGYTLTQTNHQFLSDKSVSPRLNIPVKWLYDREVTELDRCGLLPNAIQIPEISCKRIAVCAMDGNTVMGIAACHETSPGWMQIGVDVSPAYRSRGIGTYLVTLLKNRVIEQKHIPYYDTSISNYHSWNIAINSGFKPTWLEIGAVKINKNK